MDNSAAPDINVEEPTFVDNGKFITEPPRQKKTKFFVMVTLGALLIIGLVWVLSSSIRHKIQTFSAERAAKQSEKKQEADNSIAARPNIELPKPAPVVSNLPTAFNGSIGMQPDTVKPLKPISVIESSNNQNKPAALPNRPSMMLESDTKVTNTNTPSQIQPATLIKSGSLATPIKYDTVQDQANLSGSKNNGVTKTAQVHAAKLGNRDLVLARPSTVPCILETQILSNIPGTTSCITQDDIYSDNGAVKLFDKGSKVSGSYAQGLKTGDVRLAIVWERIKTTDGIVIDVEAPSADSVGAAGVPGYVDNKWIERVGAAFLLSVVEDSVALSAAKSGGNGQASFNNTQSAIPKMSEKVLEKTIDIPPTIIKNRGELVTIMVNRDLWFDHVYESTSK